MQFFTSSSRRLGIKIRLNSSQALSVIGCCWVNEKCPILTEITTRDFYLSFAKPLTNWFIRVNGTQPLFSQECARLGFVCFLRFAFFPAVFTGHVFILEFLLVHCVAYSLWLAIVVALLWFIWTNLIFITLSLLFQKHLLLWVPLTACSSVSLLTGWPNLNQWMKNTLHVLRAMQRSVKLSRIPCILLPFFSLWKQDGERIHHRVHVIFDRNGRGKWTIQIQYAVEQINSMLPCVCSVTDPRWC